MEMMMRSLPILIIATILFGCPAGAGEAVVANVVARVAHRELGPEWVPTALAIANKESRLRCDASGRGKALGIFQVVPIAAKHLGYDHKRIKEDCVYGIEAGIAHMAACLKSANGKMTARQMKACHVHGINGWRIRYGYASAGNPSS